MFKLISATLVLCALSAGAARAQTQDTVTPQDREAREQADRDRRRAERQEKDRNRDGRREPGTRCSRWKRGKA